MISKIFIKRPAMAIVISILIVLIGTIILTGLPISQYPSITPPTVTVSATYTGADAETVEQTVITPIENQINGVPGMKYISSSSTSDGRAEIHVTFEVGTDIDEAALEVQNRVSIAEPSLPEPVKRLGIVTKKANDDMLTVIGLVSPNHTYDEQFLTNYADLYLKDALTRVEGVGDIRFFGAPFSMRIWMDPAKMTNLGIAPAQVIAAVQEQNNRIPGGTVGGPPQQSNQTFEYSVILDGNLSTEEEFEHIIVKTNDEGDPVYLKDIARVELGQFSYNFNSKVNDDPSALMGALQSPGGNAVQTVEGIHKALVELKEDFPDDMDYVIPYETVSIVKASINGAVHTLLEALLLVTLIVFLFLQSWRATLITVLAIPVSIIGAFIFFNLLGFSINVLTMFGFVLAIGIVVDDAIVVVEAVQHYIDQGFSPVEATEKAMKDITSPVIAIALILASVFIPVGFIPGMVGQLYQQFAITISISVLLSAFVALTFTPALSAMLLRPSTINAESKGINKLFFRFNSWFARLTSNYTKKVQWNLKRSPLILIAIIFIFVGTITLFSTKPTGFIPQEDSGSFVIGAFLPEGSSAVRTQEFSDRISATLRKENPEILSIASLTGMNLINSSFRSNAATFFVLLKPWKERSRSVSEIVASVSQSFQMDKDGSLLVVQLPPIPGLGSSGGFTMELQDRQSGDIKAFEKITNDFLAKANQRPEIGMAYTLFTSKTPNYKIHIDREQATKMGVSIGSVYQAISSNFGSTYINDFTRFGRNFRVVVQADTTYRNSIESLKNLYVSNNQGISVPLSTVVSTQKEENPSIINHFNLFRSIQVGGATAPGYSSGDALKALEETAAETLPRGFNYNFSGLSDQELESGNATTGIFILIIVFVFLLLVALYDSWSIPFSILLSVPLGLFGSILALTFLPHLDNNIYAQVGFITLIGLAAKNAILIVEFAKERVDAGMELIQATLEAVRLRLRPIIMTSLAFVLGVTPLILSTGAGAISRETIGWTVAAGMSAATLMGIFVVPVLFVAITRLTYGKKKLAALQANYNPEKH